MANLTRWDPFGTFSEVTPLREVMNRLMEDAWIRPGGMWSQGTGQTGQGAQEGVRSFACDLYETDDAYVLTAPLPGLKPEDLEVTLQGNTLTVSGEVKPREQEREQGGYRVRERRYGRFFRQVTLPGTIQDDQIQASLEHGVLTVRVPKSEAMRSRRIQIQPGTASGSTPRVTSGEQREFTQPGSTQQPPIDAEIYTSDGDRLGTVREIEGRSFKVDAPMQPDYWLPIDAVSSVTGNRVLLSFPKDRLGDHKADAPRAA